MPHLYFFFFTELLYFFIKIVENIKKNIMQKINKMVSIIYIYIK